MKKEIIINYKKFALVKQIFPIFNKIIIVYKI